MSGRVVDRIVDHARAAAIVEGWQGAGERVVVCSGVFDLLHVGHTRRVAAARAQGDRLVIAIHGDEAAAGLEGPGRPVMSSRDRAALVAALRGVDLVVVAADRPIEELLREWKPARHLRCEESPMGEVPGGGAARGSGRDPGSRGSGALVARVRQRFAGRS